jgi:hypothetical protein
MTKKRIVVIKIVPVTAIPKANASFSELWNTSTRASTAPTRSQLMTGT